MRLKKVFALLIFLLLILSFIIPTSYVQAISINEIIQNSVEQQANDTIQNNSSVNSITTMIFFIAYVVYVIYLLYYIAKLGNKLNQPKGLLYLSFFIPLVGLILYCVYIKKEAELGKSCGKLAIFGITLPIIFVILMAISGAFAQYNALQTPIK